MGNESDFFSRLSALYDNIKRGQSYTPSYNQVLPDHVENGARASQSVFQADQHYFQVYVSEMFLAHSRQFWSEYDPVVFAGIEFLYDTKKQVVPQVVGPSLLTQYQQQLPVGVRYINTPVSGLHPYIGGDFVLIVILYRVKQNDHLRNLLGLVEKVVDVFDPSASLANYMNLSEVILDGFECILGSDQTQPVIGVRDNQSSITQNRFDPGFYALIDAPTTQIDRNNLWVRDGKLYLGSSLENAKPFRDHDFVLINISQTNSRDDIRSLPFFPRWREVQQTAIDPENWNKAKAAFRSLWLDLIATPDLTANDKEKLENDFRSELVSLRDRAKKTGEMAANNPPESSSMERDSKFRDLDQLLKSLD